MSARCPLGRGAFRIAPSRSGTTGETRIVSPEEIPGDEKAECGRRFVNRRFRVAPSHAGTWFMKLFAPFKKTNERYKSARELSRGQSTYLDAIIEPMTGPPVSVFPGRRGVSLSLCSSDVIATRCCRSPIFCDLAHEIRCAETPPRRARGVCRTSRREQGQSNSPDPRILVIGACSAVTANCVHNASPSLCLSRSLAECRQFRR